MSGQWVLALPVSVPLLRSGRSADAALRPTEPDLFAFTGAGSHHELLQAAALFGGTGSPGVSSR